MSAARGDSQCLICTIEDFFPKELMVKWKKNAKQITDNLKTWPKQVNGDTYLTASFLTVESSEWDSNAVYTCEVEHRGTEYIKSVSKGTTVAHVLLFCEEESAIGDMFDFV